MKLNNILAIIVFLFLIFLIFLNFYADKKINEKMTELEGRAVSGASGFIGLTILPPGCLINLVDGYNFFSICANMSNYSVTNVLDPIEGNYSFVLGWNESDQNFDVYSVASAVKPFDEFHPNKSYFVYFLENSGDLNFPGTLYSGVIELELPQNYSTPFYPFECTANVSKYLNTMANDYMFMLKWNTTTDEFDIWARLSLSKPFDEIKKGGGQFIYVVSNTGTILRYNETFICL